MRASELLRLRDANPDLYRARLREIEERALGSPSASAPPNAGASTAYPAPHRSRAFESLIEQFRAQGVLSDSQSTGLRQIRRGTIYACAQMRAHMLSSLPLRLYRMDERADKGGRGRVDHRNPMARLGWPTRVRGQRVTEAGAIVEVSDHPLSKILDRPNADWSGRALIQSTEIGLGLVGEAHWQLELPGVRSISWLKHDRLEVIKAGPSDKYRTVAGWELDRRMPGGGSTLRPEEVVWIRYVDPESPDYGTLAPADVASLGATAYFEALRSNRDLFRQGLRAAGAFVPPEEMAALDFEQAEELTRDVDSLLRGSKNNHTTPVFPYRVNFERFDVSPKDAEFVALMDFAIEDTARAFGLPIEMIGGSRRTYSNLENALTAVWMHTLEPEACFIAEELTAKLLPQAGLTDHFLAFDLTDVAALQEDETARWSRAKEQIGAGALTVNEWREDEGLDPLPWGSAWWAQAGLMPVVDADVALPEPAAPDAPDALPAADEEDDPTAEPLSAAWIAAALRSAEPEDAPVEIGPGRMVEYGGEEHRAILRALDDAENPEIDKFAAAVSELMRRQAESLADALSDGKRAHMRLGIGDILKLFNRARWVREFRERGMKDLRSAQRVGLDIAEGMIDSQADWDPNAPEAIRELRRQTQRFAEEVNDTTWRLLRGSLVVGLRDGETPRDLARRVQSVMGGRIKSSAELIARTEVHQAVQRGSLRAAQSMSIADSLTKEWVSGGDDRVRESHRDAHGQTVALDDDFDVGGATGPMPGNLGAAEEDINCRCTVRYRRDRRAVDSIKETQHDAVHAPATG